MGHLKDSPVPTAPAARLWSRLGTKIPIWEVDIGDVDIGDSGIIPVMPMLQTARLCPSNLSRHPICVRM